MRQKRAAAAGGRLAFNTALTSTASTRCGGNAVATLTSSGIKLPWGQRQHSSLGRVVQRANRDGSVDAQSNLVLRPARVQGVLGCGREAKRERESIRARVSLVAPGRCLGSAFRACPIKNYGGDSLYRFDGNKRQEKAPLGISRGKVALGSGVARQVKSGEQANLCGKARAFEKIIGRCGRS